jgi:integrase
MAKDWRIGLRRFGRDEREDSLIRKSIVERRPGTTQIFFDDRVRGFGLKITDKGHESFVYQYRPEGQRYPKRITFKGVHSVAQARALASEHAAGHFAEVAERPSGGSETLAEVVDQFFHLQGKNYTPQTARNMRRSLERHVLPVLGQMPYETINRRDLARLRDEVAKRAGKHAAAAALKNLSTIWSKHWIDYASPDFTWPKPRSPLADEDRNGNGRKLSDDEIRQFWAATFKLRDAQDAPVPHKGAYWRFLLLTGMRRTSAARITREQLVGNVLHILGAKSKPAYELPLPPPALELLRAHWGATWAFEPLGDFDTLKRTLDRQLPIAHWTIHTLRHTCRSLLSRVTTADVAKLCVGHTLKGMDRVYDHHTYEAEKQKAMEGLATLVFDIVNK